MLPRRAPVQNEEQRRATEGPKQQKPNEDILMHNQKRVIEVKLYELRLKLEDEDKYIDHFSIHTYVGRTVFRLPPEEVEERLAMERKVLEENFSKQKAKKSAKSSAQETHEVAQRKIEQMERFRRALRIRPGAKEGEAFDVELQVGCIVSAVMSVI